MLLIYLILVFGTTVLTRKPGRRRFQLELFWSWKEILKPEGRTGSVTRGGLLLENLLNIALLFPAGILLAMVWGRRLRWYQGLIFGLAVSMVIEVFQLVLCRGLFEFDDIIHNGLYDRDTDGEFGSQKDIRIIEIKSRRTLTVKPVIVRRLFKCI